jgi:NAD+ diphosphatase
MYPTLRPTSQLDRQAALRTDADALAALWRAPDTRCLLLVGGKPVIVSDAARTSSAIRWVSVPDASGMLFDLGLTVPDPQHLAALFLGLEDGTRSAQFALALPPVDAAHSHPLLTPAVDLRSLATQGVLSPGDVSLLGLAKSLADWHGSYGHCAKCGTATASTEGGWRRDCPSCQSASYPRTDPCVIMLISDGDRCIVTREPRFPENMYSLPAGYIEPGEDIEHAVIRETHEELGIRVHDVTYKRSQPWPFPHSLMIGCFATTIETTLKRDPAEIDDARWVTRDELLAMVNNQHPEGIWVPGLHAIANSLIRDWLAATS